MCDYCVPAAEHRGANITAARWEREEQLCGVLSLVSSQQAMPADSRVTGTGEGMEERSGHEGRRGGGQLTHSHNALIHAYLVFIMNIPLVQV